MFLAWPGHQMARNTLAGDLPLGIHDHRYSLRLQLLVGTVVNTIYHEFEEGGGRGLNAFEFRSGQMKGPPKTKRLGLRFLVSGLKEVLSPHEWLWMAAKDLHNVSCKGPAAWIVEEGPVEQEVTHLYTPSNRVDVEDLYHPFDSVDEVRNHVMNFLALVESGYETVDSSKLHGMSTMSMVAGGEKYLAKFSNRVILDGTVRLWVGFGWVNEGPPTADQVTKIPHVVE